MAHLLSDRCEPADRARVAIGGAGVKAAVFTGLLRARRGRLCYTTSMKMKAVPLSTLLLLCCAPRGAQRATPPTATGLPAEPTRLSLPLPTDEKLLLQIELHATFQAWMTGVQQASRSASHTVLEIPLVVTRGPRPGDKVLELSVRRVYGKHGSGKLTSFDTDRGPDEKAQRPVPWTRLKDLSFVATLRASGKISDFAVAGRPAEPKTPQDRHWREGTVKSIARFLNEMVLYLPRRPVRAGDTWSVEAKNVDGARGVLWHHPPQYGTGEPRQVRCQVTQLWTHAGRVAAVVLLKDAVLESAMARGRATAGAPALGPLAEWFWGTAPDPRLGEVRINPSPGVYLDQTVRRCYSWHHIGGINRDLSAQITTRIRLLPMRDDGKQKRPSD